jgi:hypothetical protein
MKELFINILTIQATNITSFFNEYFWNNLIVGISSPNLREISNPLNYSPSFLSYEEWIKCFKGNTLWKVFLSLPPADNFSVTEQTKLLTDNLYKYTFQHYKFFMIVHNINQGTEIFYPPESTHEFTMDLRLIHVLIKNIKYNLINHIHIEWGKNPGLIVKSWLIK